MNICNLLASDPSEALRMLRQFAEEAGRIVFPQAAAERPGSTGGVLSVWYDPSGHGDWTIGGNILIGKIGDREGRRRFDSTVLYDHHAAVKNTSMIEARLVGRTDAEGRAIIASSQIADDTPEDPLAKRYGGGIICCHDRVASSFSGLPWKWDEVMSAHTVYRTGHSITKGRVYQIIKVSNNEHLAAHAAEHFRFAA